MKKVLLCLTIIASAMFLTGCTMTKHLAYFQNMDTVDITQKKEIPQVRIKPNDELTIYVSATTPEAAMPFNMNLATAYGGSYQSYSTYQSNLYAYIVDTDGQINFPVLGKVDVIGLTRSQVEDKLTELIKPYFSATEKPVVKCRISNFTVTVIGEVTGSRRVSVGNDRMSIIEALASAGDLTVYGKRDNILLIRENAQGQKMFTRFNLNDARVFNSEFYYLQQNDIVYVEPHKAKARSTEVNSYMFWTPISSLAISLGTLGISLANIINK